MSGAAAYAHHSFAGTYVEDKLMKIEGKVVEFNIRNPHSFILIEVRRRTARPSRWGGEWGGVTQLSQGGVTRFTLEVGDHLIIEGAPPRDSLGQEGPGPQGVASGHRQETRVGMGRERSLARTRGET